MAFHNDRTLVNEHVFVFRRTGSKYWYYQLQFEKTRNPRAASTGEEDLALAIAVAKDKAKAALKLVLDDRPLTAPTFRGAAAGFKAWLLQRKQAETSSKRYCHDFDGYILSFFGDRKINTLSYEDAEAYAKWRQGEKGVGWKKSPPKNQTINRELNTLRHLMTYCIKNRWLKKEDRPKFPSLPTSRNTKDKSQPVDEPKNSWFTPWEFITLRRLHWQYVQAANMDPFEFTERKYQHYLILLQYYLGCRTEEVYNLKHNDYVDHTYRDGDFKVTSVHIFLEGSGKKRDFIAPAIVRSLLHKLRDLTQQPPDGKVAPVKRPNYFYYFLLESGLYLDEYNVGRSRTSLRHTRATIELYYRRDKISPIALATYMGHTIAEQERTYSKIFRILQSEALHMRSRRTGKLNLAFQWLQQAREYRQKLPARIRSRRKAA